MAKIVILIILAVGFACTFMYLKRKRHSPHDEQIEMIALIRENAENALSIIRREEGLDISFNDDSVAVVEEYIDRNRDNIDAETKKRFVAIFGSFLGETVIATYGGHWLEHEDHGWGVKTVGDITAFPYAKVTKLLDNGLEDSICSFITAIPAIAEHSKK